MWDWLSTLVSGQPHFIVGGAERPYLFRWWLLPRNPWLNVYLHKFVRDDDDRALHDHPWASLSICLSGKYREHTDAGTFERGAGSVVYRTAEHRHRIELFDNQPAWTLFITGPRVRDWGFHCPQGWIPWQQFVARGSEGEIGRGCGEEIR